MQRKVTNLSEPVHEEWTKYFVNGIECKRDAIYQTILDHHFYTGKINLEKKYHYKSHEETLTVESDIPDFFSSFIKRATSKHNESKNKKSSFSLDTKEFTKKHDPASEEYKILVGKMIHTVDMFYDASDNYSDHIKNFRIAARDCVGYLRENTTNIDTPYNKVNHESALLLTEYMFDLVAYSMSKLYASFDLDDPKLQGQIEFPNMAFDTSSIKETWDESWDDSKKSKYLEKYLSVLSKQADVVHGNMRKHQLFNDSASKAGLKETLEEFKKSIKALQDKKRALDKTHHIASSTKSKIASFFHRQPREADAVQPASQSNSNSHHGARRRAHR